MDERGAHKDKPLRMGGGGFQGNGTSCRKCRGGGGKGPSASPPSDKGV